MDDMTPHKGVNECLSIQSDVKHRLFARAYNNRCNRRLNHTVAHYNTQKKRKYIRPNMRESFPFKRTLFDDSTSGIRRNVQTSGSPLVSGILFVSY